MKDIVFFDIDGTLLDHDKKIPESTKHAVDMLKKSGVDVAIATGRAPFMFEDIRNELGIDSFVSFNGQYVVYQGEVIYANPLDRNVLKQVDEYAAGYSHPLVFLDHQGMKANARLHSHIKESIGSLKMEHPEYDPDYYKDRDIYQALLFSTAAEQHLYDGRFDGIKFIRWHEKSQDILPAGGSKAKGIEVFLGQLGIPRSRVYAFGDALNDLEMLQYAGTGVAMGNALAEVKQAASHVTKDVTEDGILHGLKMVGLLK
ncbi:Cof-type HAD-IIB family hydrolase [Bacillus marinisedimentorum]|uniref:Cof-type HAD-IIB family hydrolase n=1 Tax=Bacillus marinisedimentorum TaxID=1821260 RepID=UPI0007E01DC1|nr:Cof-type HAD-IIB family hydrolase [Bacillus marinisedimentorum]